MKKGLYQPIQALTIWGEISFKKEPASSPSFAAGPSICGIRIPELVYRMTSTFVLRISSSVLI